ncbi:Adhesion defective protein 1 [Purpureocillium lavendulum]|uniref:Adhesion defective protein 1 n=1 Tax=Purpureocillium lavendulum TaxID=1247861 RepID=A0AB34FQB7_9HYPO|nr:Adhesion defective protein 1 [Purpureocillium lavendulum]
MVHPSRQGALQHKDASSGAALFSPSVARVAASTARDWAYVDSWLASRLPAGRASPPFERNGDTLKALLSLSAHNEAADEERLLLARADAAALGELHSYCEGAAVRQSLPAQVLAAIESNLPKDGSNALTSLAQLALQVRDSDADPQALGRSVVALHGSLFDTEQMTLRVDSLRRDAERAVDEAAELLNSLQDHRYRPSSDMAKRNLELQRRIKAASSALPPEHTDRVVAADSSLLSHPTVGCVATREHHFLELLSRKRELEDQVAAFAGLSSDPDEARNEVEALRRQLQAITSHRDAAFEDLVDRDSPVKRRA